MWAFGSGDTALMDVSCVTLRWSLDVSLALYYTSFFILRLPPLYHDTVIYSLKLYMIFAWYLMHYGKSVPLSSTYLLICYCLYVGYTLCGIMH